MDTEQGFQDTQETTYAQFENQINFIPVSFNIKHELIPVSYTHLDVYKRQVIDNLNINKDNEIRLRTKTINECQYDKKTIMNRQ